MKYRFSHLLNYKGWHLFLGLSVVSCLITYFINNYIITNEVYYTSFVDTLSQDRIEKIIDINERWAWVAYFFIPIFLLIKFSLVSMVLNIGSLLFDLKLPFKRAFLIAMWAESIFILRAFIKLSFLWFNRCSLSFEYFHFFTPLSLINFFKVGDVDRWCIYPLQTVNLFELSYWFVLAYLVGIEVQKSFLKSFEFVVSTYVSSLLVWVVFVVFLTLNLS